MLLVPFNAIVNALPLYKEDNNNIMLTNHMLNLQLEFIQEQMENNLELITTLRNELYEAKLYYSNDYDQEYETNDSFYAANGKNVAL